jgi:AAA family ATP:ADP antiporter
MRKLGVTAALLILPLAILGSSLAFLMVPTLYVASALVISENGLNYSLQQTARESLYVVTTPDEKYKARAFTNMFVHRLAKGAAIFVVIGLIHLSIPVRYLSLVTVVVMSLMIFCSIFAGRRFREKSLVEEAQVKAA